MLYFPWFKIHMLIQTQTDNQSVSRTDRQAGTQADRDTNILISRWRTFRIMTSFLLQKVGHHMKRELQNRREKTQESNSTTKVL